MLKGSNRAQRVRRLRVVPGLDNSCALIRPHAVPCPIADFKEILLRFTSQSAIDLFTILRIAFIFCILCNIIIYYFVPVSYQ